MKLIKNNKIKNLELKILDMYHLIFKKTFYTKLIEDCDAKFYIHNLISRNFYQVAKDRDNTKIPKNFLSYEAFETQLFLVLISKSKCFFDIGAHVGYYSILYAKLKPNSNVYSFEILKEFCKEINYQSKLNNINNINILNVAVGDGKKKIKFQNFYSSNNLLSVSLDEFVSSYYLEPDLIKMDIEGFEAVALNSFQTYLEKRKPTIILSLHPNFIKKISPDSKNILKFLHKIYEQIFILDSNKNNYTLKKISHNSIIKENSTLLLINKINLKKHKLRIK